MGETRSGERADSFVRQAVSWFRRTGSGVAVRRFDREQAIYVDGDPAQSVFCVDSGCVKIVVAGPDGRECALGLQVEGELFGELCVYGQTRRCETAIAVSPVTVRSVSARQFMEFVAQQDLQVSLIDHLAAQLLTQQRSIAILLNENCESRLAHTLLALGRKLAGKGSPQIHLTHMELGEMIGTTRSRVGEFLKAFRELGLVRTFGREGVHPDVEQLEAFCQGRRAVSN